MFLSVKLHVYTGYLLRTIWSAFIYYARDEEWELTNMHKNHENPMAYIVLSKLSLLTLNL